MVKIVNCIYILLQLKKDVQYNKYKQSSMYLYIIPWKCQRAHVETF